MNNNEPHAFKCMQANQICMAWRKGIMALIFNDAGRGKNWNHFMRICVRNKMRINNKVWRFMVRQFACAHLASSKPCVSGSWAPEMPPLLTDSNQAPVRACFLFYTGHAVKKIHERVDQKDLKAVIACSAKPHFCIMSLQTST